MTLRPVTADDLPGIEALLRRHLATSMFILVNLREHGLQSDVPRGLSLWLAEDGAGVFAISNEGMVMPQMPGAGAAHWQAAVEVVDRPLIGVLGDPAQARAFLRGAGLGDAPTNLDQDEKAFALDLDDLCLPPTTGIALRSATSGDRARMVAWRRGYHIECLGTSAKDAQPQAERDIDHYQTADSHRILSDNGRDVAMTGFNARLSDIVQIGGVYTPPALRARGYARTAVGMHLAEARGGGARQALLFSSSPQAIRAYRALGFQPNGGYSLVLFEGPQEVHP